jgi:hypothetical protein
VGVHRTPQSHTCHRSITGEAATGRTRLTRDEINTIVGSLARS